jgi:hypothetical protein
MEMITSFIVAAVCCLFCITAASDPPAVFSIVIAGNSFGFDGMKKAYP